MQAEDKIKVSVIVPMFNCEKTVSKMIESLKKQTLESFEVILINDGSLDSTEKKVLDHVDMDERFKYYKQSNKGVSSARNLGLSKSKGEYVSFLDADDFYDHDYLKKMYNTAQKKNADIVYCGYKIISNNDSKPRPKRTKFTQNNVLTLYLLGKISVHTTGWLINRELLSTAKLKFDETMSWGEDIYFFSKALSNANKVSYVKDYLTNYVSNHSVNQLSSFDLRKIDADYVMVKKLQDNFSNHNEHIDRVLRGYTLPALILNKLYVAHKRNYQESEVQYYYNKYEENINELKYINGLRSIKIFILKVYLERHYKD